MNNNVSNNCPHLSSNTNVPRKKHSPSFKPLDFSGNNIFESYI